MENTIMDTQYGISKYGNIVCSVCIQKDLFLTLVDVDGIPNFYVTADSCFEAFIEEEDTFLDHYISSFNGVDLTDYGCMLDTIFDEKSIFKFYILYLVRLVSMDFDMVVSFISSSKNKNIQDIF